VYQSLLTRRYLTSKIMPWLAMTSVALCCMLTLLVWSIMGGFLDVFREIGRKMEGDVSISWQTVGFPYYEDLIARLEKDEGVAAAAPVIRTFGMVSLPDDRTSPATIQGVDERYAKVSNYEESIWWRPTETAARTDEVGKAFLEWKGRTDVLFSEFLSRRGIKAQIMDPRLDPDWPKKIQRDFDKTRVLDDGRPVEPPPPGSFRSWEQMYRDGLRLMVADPRTGAERGGAVLGIEMGGLTHREPGIWYSAPEFVAARRSDGDHVWTSAFLPSRSVMITVLPMDRMGRDISTRSLKLPVANEFRSGFFETDKSMILVHLSVLQKLLKMEQGEVIESGPVDPYAMEVSGGVERPAQTRVVRVEPAKVTMVIVKAGRGFSSEQLRERCRGVYARFAEAHRGQVPTSEQLEQAKGITTWERSFAPFIGQVEKETVTILLMLLVISLVCTVLILAIFWSMVNEKVKDIGILRSVGCSRSGVAWIWLRYGVFIGVVGAAAGLSLGCVLVWNINPIHEWLGRAAGVSVWDPSVYYLPEIPNKVKPDKAAIVFACAVALSLLGALIPAVRAANMDPVRSLRFE
jgi:lipoprotein-releasing system permease protein